MGNIAVDRICLCSVRIKSLEALAKVADGQATKIIIPSDLTNLANVVTSAAELAKK